jgi:hypothetical protein
MQLFTFLSTKSNTFFEKKLMFFFVFLIICSCVNKKNNIEASTKSDMDNSTIINAPTNKSQGKIVNLHQGCGFNYNVESPEIKLTYPNQREINEIENILAYSGIPMNFEVYAANIDNAVATVINNKRYIIYDPTLLRIVDKNSNSYWNSMSILAHEIGHHLSGHTMKNDIDSHKRELEADKFSGFILFKMGATLEQAIYTISLLGTEIDSESHPSKYRRIQSITNGWYEASKQVSKSAIPPANEFNDQIVGIEYKLEDFYSKEEILEYKYDLNELGPFVGYIISNTYFNSKPSSIIVEITELPKNIKDLPYMFGKNKRVEIYLDEPQNAPNATLGYYEDVMQPGNKLLFKIHQSDGSGGYPSLNYIKVLNRN